MAAARKHNRRTNRGRLNALYKVCSVVLILVALLAGCIVFFRVQTIEVLGNQTYETAQILEVAGVKEGSNLFAVNRPLLARKIRKALPYIDRASVTWKLPDTLVITVSETSAAGAIAADGIWWTIDGAGKLLAQGPDRPAQGFAVEGLTPLAPAPGTFLAVAEEESGKLASLLDLMAALKQEKLLEKTQKIDLGDGYLLKIEYDGCFFLQIPATEDLAYRMRFFREALESGSLADGQQYTVDMTLAGETRFIPK